MTNIYKSHATTPSFWSAARRDIVGEQVEALIALFCRWADRRQFRNLEEGFVAELGAYVLSVREGRMFEAKLHWAEIDRIMDRQYARHMARSCVRMPCKASTTNLARYGASDETDALAGQLRPSNWHAVA